MRLPKRVPAAVHLAGLLSVAVLLFQPVRSPLGVFFVGRLPALIELIALAVPILTIVLSAGSTVNRGRPDRGSSAEVLVSLLLRSTAIAAAAMGPLAVGCGILSVPPLRVAMMAILLLILAIAAALLAFPAVLLLPGTTLRHLVVWSIVLLFLVATALYAPSVNPVVLARSVIGEGGLAPVVVYCTGMAGLLAVNAGLLVRRERKP